MKPGSFIDMKRYTYNKIDVERTDVYFLKFQAKQSRNI